MNASQFQAPASAPAQINASQFQAPAPAAQPRPPSGQFATINPYATTMSKATAPKRSSTQLTIQQTAKGSAGISKEQALIIIDQLLGNLEATQQKQTKYFEKEALKQARRSQMLERIHNVEKDKDRILHEAQALEKRQGTIKSQASFRRGVLIPKEEWEQKL